MNDDGLDLLETQYQVHNKGAITPSFLIAPLQNGRIGHVQCSVWRGVTVPVGDIVLGSAFYVGETDNVGAKTWETTRLLFQAAEELLGCVSWRCHLHS